MPKSPSTIVSTVAHASAKIKMSPVSYAKRSSYARQARLLAACAIAASASCLTLAGNRPAGATPINWTNGGGTGVWSNSANWDTNSTPTSTSDVTIGSPATTATPSEDDISVTIANLTVNASSELDVAASVNLYIASGGTITDNGTIKVNPTAGNYGTGIGINGAVLLTGSGDLVLNAISGNVGSANIYDNSYSNLTQDTNHTISGTGEITVNTFTNNGTVNANSSGNTLLLTRAAFTNTNLMEATGGGILQLNAGFTNTGGTIKANGGTVLLNGGSVSGGTLASASGSEIDEQNYTTLANVTLSTGSNLKVMDGNDLYFANGITNNGTITVNKGGSNAGTGIGINGTVDLTGTGSIVLNAFAGNVGTANIYDGGYSNLTQEANHTISGTGEITVNNFTNNGTVNANSSGNTLLLTHAAYINTNLMEATGGGILQLNAGFTNTGGTINANGGTVLLNGGSVTGGTLSSASGSEIDEQNYTTLANVTLSTGSNLNVLDGNNLYFASGITNDGTITVNKGGSNTGTGIGINGTVDLTGTGSIHLNAYHDPTSGATNVGTARIFDLGSSNLTQEAGHTISGIGQINVNSFLNKGIVDANQRVNSTIDGGTVQGVLQIITNQNTYTNIGTLEATNGGLLEISSSVTNTDGTNNGTILANGGNVQLDNNAIISNGTLTSSGGGAFMVAGAAHLNSVTLSAGTQMVVNAGVNLLLDDPQLPTADTITNDGTITINGIASNNGTGLGITNTVDLAGTGSIVLNAFAGNLATANIFDGGYSNLTQEANHTISGTGEITVNSFTNNGTVNANSNGNTLQITNTNTNNGTYEATNGGTLSLNGNFTNTGLLLANAGKVQLVGGTVTGGTLTSSNGGEIDEQSSTNMGSVTLTTGTHLNVMDGNNLYFASGSTITNNGTITVNKGGTNNGTGIGINNAVDLAGNGSIVLNANAANIGTANIFDGGYSNLTQDINHTISGTGEITVNSFTNNGTVNANSNGNTLQVGRTNTNNGTYEATNGGTLNISNLTNYQLLLYSSDTLTGGIYKAIDSGTGATLVLNDGNITTNAADVTISGVNSAFAQINTLAANQGEFRVLNNRNFTAQAGFNNQGGLLQLGGGTFAITSGSFTNEGTVQGFGTVTPLVNNTGLIEATGGTLALSNGALDAAMNNATLQSDAGATLDLSGGTTSSTTLYLVNNGNLNLGNNNVTVNTDYTNANFGTGNSFNPHANVSTTGGKILATGNTDVTVTGSGITVASSTSALNTYTMNFGNVHANSSATLAYNITNPGNSGPIIRGAVQTTVNGGNISDSRLGGNGVIPGNGSVAPGQTTSANDVTFTPGGQDGALVGQVIHIEGNFDNIHQNNINITGAAWNLAAPSVSPTTIALGDVHVGGSVTRNIAVSNTAPNDGFSEQLDGQLGSGSGNLSTNGASFSGLNAGSSVTPANALNVTLDTSAAGIRNGSATLALQSDGTAVGNSGLGITALNPLAISMSATAYRLANPVVNSPTGTTINLGVIHVGDVGTQNLSLTNNVPSDGFSENLDASLGSLTGSAFVVTNPNPVVLTPGSTNTVGSLQVGVSTATAGLNKTGTATLNLISDGTGIDTLGTTTLTPIVYNVSATVNNYALPTILLQSNSAGASLVKDSSTLYTLNLGTTTQGAGSLFADLGFGNAATGPADTVAGNFTLNAASFNLTGFNSFSGIGAGQNTTGQDVTLSDITAGTFSGSITYNPFGQNSSGYNSPFSPITINLSGTVNSSTPEPTTLALLAVGSLGLLVRRRKTA